LPTFSSALSVVYREPQLVAFSLVRLQPKFFGCSGKSFARLSPSTSGRVQGENVLYAHLADRGLAMITGCGHGGVLELLDYGRRTFQGGDRVCGVYGGLHISPFGDWGEKHEAVIQALRKYGIEQLGCNHCTGAKAVRRMIELGLPVIRGSARHGSSTDLYLGNGDVLDIGGE
jgi:7,8-dihydropterin-6-yl-methyl-4-(beta-D-ribofuranosyl)aminobenzene 5'-phosphate synthase